VSEPIRYRLDDVRRHAGELVAAAGLIPRRAVVLASHLLWYDAAGAARFGIASLPGWLERLTVGEFDMTAEGKVMTERNGTAVLDGQNGVPPLILERGAALAVEKAREAGVGLVRVSNVGPTGPAAALAAEIALGPFAVVILGPGPSFSVALPSDQGLPAVFDSALAADVEPTAAWPPGLGPWATVLAPAEGWVILANAVAAWEPLDRFHARVNATLGEVLAPARPGQIAPAAWEVARRTVRERGIPLAAAERDALVDWARRLRVPLLESDAC
jgi:LDH2 family malate/lactate/ureidoglycolate dehydrogenase